MSNSNKLAKDRTDWAEDRTILANERTFAGWMRTAFAAIGIGFGAFEPTWVAKAVATIFVLTAVYIFWAAQDSACATLQRLDDNEAHAQPARRMKTLALIFACGSIAVGGILWML